MLGRVPGVTQTRIGFIGGTEFVEARYDPRRVGLPALVRALKGAGSLYKVVVRSRAAYRRATQQISRTDVQLRRARKRFRRAKYNLRAQHPDLYYLDLTEAQALALNSWAYFGGAFPAVLTADQQALRKRLATRLRTKRRRGLYPRRDGAARRRYRRALLRWLSR